MNLDDFSIPCVGNITTGDMIVFEEVVFKGKPMVTKMIGERLVVAEIIEDHYEDNYHVVELRVLHSEKTQPLSKDSIVTRKAGTIYRRGTMRRPWENEDERNASYDSRQGMKIEKPKPKFKVKT